MKRVLQILGALLIVMLMSMPVAAAPSVFLDDKQLSFEVPPIIEDGRTLVPLRAIFEALGANVAWDNSTQTVTATKGEITIQLQIGSSVAYKNNKSVPLDVPGSIIQNRTMVPLRFVSEGLGANVTWNDITETINIKQTRTIPLYAQALKEPKVSEDDHFIIYYTDSDASCIKEVTQKLEENYSKVINDLQAPPLAKINLIIYPNLADYHQAINRPTAPDWLVGTSKGPTDIIIVSPINPGPAHNYKSMLQVVVHEFTHSASMKICPTIYEQRWLGEGVALYEAGQFRTPPAKCPSLAELNSSDTAIYGVGYVLIEYIVDQWGMESLRELIKAKGDIPTVLHISTAEFETGWNAYISSKY